MKFVNRRQWLETSVLAAVLSGIPRNALAESLTLKVFNPYGPIDDYPTIRPYLFDIKKGKPLLDRLWKRYLKGGQRIDGERAVIGMFLLWRVIPRLKDRVRFSKAAQQMAGKLAKEHPEHPAGFIWGGVFFGSEALAAGVLNSVHLAPEIEQRFKAAAELDGDYLYGLADTLLAKLYFKAPTFPVSIGDYKKAEVHLKRAEKQARNKFAVWYMVAAEYEYLVKGKEAAFRMLDRMESEIKPVDMSTMYALDSMTSDAKAFRQAIETKKYSKYFWDPFLEMAKPGLKL